MSVVMPSRPSGGSQKSKSRSQQQQQPQRCEGEPEESISLTSVVRHASPPSPSAVSASSIPVAVQAYAMPGVALPTPYVAASVPYPDLGRDDDHDRALEWEHAEQPGEHQSDEAHLLAVGGVMPSAPSFRLMYSTSLLQDVGLNASEQKQQLHHSHHHQQSYQPPIQHLQHAAHTKAAVQPQLHALPVVGASATPVDAKAAAEARLAYLRAKASAAHRREQIDAQAIASGRTMPEQAPAVVHVHHRVAAGDDITSLAVHFGTSESAIRAQNRRLVFHVLDNVVGESIDIPATRGFEGYKVDIESTEQDAATRAAMAVRAFQARTQCSSTESKFYLEEHDYNVPAAIAAYEEDAAWEASQKGTPQRRSAAAPPNDERPLLRQHVRL